jgi:hypothetical protein
MEPSLSPGESGILAIHQVYSVRKADSAWMTAHPDRTHHRTIRQEVVAGFPTIRTLREVYDFKRIGRFS